MDKHRPHAPTKRPPLGIFNPRNQTAECSHCKSQFVSNEGMVTRGFALCPACDARD